MSRHRLLRWLGTRSPTEATPDPIEGLLEDEGLTPDILRQCREHKVLLGTRLASAAVARGQLDEARAVRALSRHVGLPGLCLGSAVIDLKLPALPTGLTRDQLVLPIRQEEGGAIVVACGDPPEADLEHDLEIALGRRVLAYVALHHPLSRNVMAAAQIRAEHPDATALLGADLAPEQLTSREPRAETVVYIPPLPALPATPALEEESPCDALVALAPGEPRTQVLEILQGLGLRTEVAGAGPEALRVIARAAPPLVIMSARLDGRPGTEVMRVSHRGDRYGHCRWLLATEGDLRPANADESSHLTVASYEDLPTLTRELVLGLDRRDDAPPLRWRHAARAAWMHARAAGEENDREARHRALSRALQHDPLFGDAVIEAARVAFEAQQLVLAEAHFELAAQLNVLDAAGLCDWATTLQLLGRARGAASAWKLAASAWPDPDVATELTRHADSLLHRPTTQSGG